MIGRRSLLTAALPAFAATQSWWAQRRTGANCFNRSVTPAWIEAAQAARITTVRLAFEKWGGTDYLLGSADAYRGLVPAHLKQLIATLDRFAAHKVGVLPVPISMPGARWKQSNGGRRDGRLWRDRRYWKDAARYWRDLASALREHPAIVGLDLMNEPSPELEWGRTDFADGGHPVWAKTVRGTAGDLNALHAELIGAIRAVDTRVPLIIESGLYATPWALASVEPVAETNVLYSIHMYEPYDYTTWRLNGGRRQAPARDWLERFFEPVRTWMQQHQLPPERLLIGEFGCARRCPGAAAYLTDLVALFERERWHWLFYSFREDNWDGMDYELGAAPPPGWYWEAAEKNALAPRYEELYSKRSGNPLWNAIAGKL